MVTRSLAGYHVGSLSVERQMRNFVVVPAADELRSRLITVFIIPAAADEAATRVFHSSFYRPLLFSYFLLCASPSDSSAAGSDSWLHLCFYHLAPKPTPVAQADYI